MSISIVVFPDSYYRLQQCVLRTIIYSVIVLMNLSAFATDSHPTPTASFTAMLNPFSPNMVLLDATSSSEPDALIETIETYEWWASDGQIFFGSQTNIRFESDDLYTIALQVTDNNGLTDTSWHTMSVGNRKTTCESNATYFVETQELFIPFVAMYDPFHHADKEKITVVSVTLQQLLDDEFKFSVKTESLKLEKEIAKRNNPCYAIYAEIDRILYISFINVISQQNNMPLGVYQATFKQKDNDIFILKTLVQQVE